MENAKKYDKHDFITPEFLAHYFDAVYEPMPRITFSYFPTTLHKVVVSKNVDSYGWRIWCYHNGVLESQTVLTSIKDLITALFLFGVPTLAVRIQNDCLTTK